MFFPIIGSVYNAMKMNELNMKWQQRKENPYMPKGDEDPVITRLREDAAKVRESNIISSIDSKLKAGCELTDEELQYLKVKNPQLYKEAMEIKQERQAYKKELANCKTKEDVERLKMNKINGYLAQAKSVLGNANLSKGEKCAQMEKIFRRMMGIENEHRAFIKTTRFANLPREEELAEEKQAREEERSSEAGETKADNTDSGDTQESIPNPDTGEAGEAGADSFEQAKEDLSSMMKEVSANRMPARADATNSGTYNARGVIISTEPASFGSTRKRNQKG